MRVRGGGTHAVIENFADCRKCRKSLSGATIRVDVGYFDGEKRLFIRIFAIRRCIYLFVKKDWGVYRTGDNETSDNEKSSSYANDSLGDCNGCFAFSVRSMAGIAKFDN